ncbi:DNA polymerase [Loktanella phage pCB2051-A]|uniref:DNA polymerase n=1 Tax=Loktanella phage pCB2051-A TaxID=754044 RepID=M4QRH3_9CAUD|nr:DNA polymerase [Loktanella phage pCB2051-A]AGH31453.1 DNA polymerase [Loktanella phage pCB2051-A]
MARKKQRLVCDVECYINYFLCAFRDIDTGEEFGVETVWDPLSKKDRLFLRDTMRNNTIITFNGINYDMFIITLAISGADTETMKEATGRIIEDQVKYWELEKEYKVKVPRDLDHIDLIEVAPGSASLKIYNGRIHGRRMQDLPIEHNATLTKTQINETYDYCFNDLDATKGLFEALSSELELRTALTMEYGIDLRSKSDAQVAEAIIQQQVTKIIGTAPKRPTVSVGTKYEYHIPDFIQFKHPVMVDMLERVRHAKFKVNKAGRVDLPEELEQRIHLGYSTYQMGIGGLHSTEKCQSITRKPGWKLRDSDVTSYYPRIIINQRLSPKHMGGPFLRVYKGIVDRRVEAKAKVKEIEEELKTAGENYAVELREQLKREQTAADGGKIMVNGSFGKFGSKYAKIYSPDLLIQTTVTGQLALLMLIEWMEEEGISIVSANTDGIVAYFPDDMEDLYYEIIKDWERQTGFNMEFTDYKGLYSRDVNSYVAIYDNGKVKTKGAFSTGTLQVNPVSEISILAFVEWLKNGTPFAETIRGCKDIRKFVTVRTVNGGALHGDIHMPNRIVGLQGKYLGKAVRWYYSTSRDSCMFYKKPNGSGNHNKVPMSEGAWPMMTMPDEFPTDIDYQYYFNQCIEFMYDVGYITDVTGNRKLA